MRILSSRLESVILSHVSWRYHVPLACIGALKEQDCLRAAGLKWNIMFSKTFRYTTSHCEEKETPPFNELILSWNGLRPLQGKWTFLVSLDNDEWLKYAEWTPHGQRSFKSAGKFTQSYQDIASPKEGFCTSFRIKVEGDDLSRLHALHVCISNLSNHVISPPKNLPSVLLKVPGKSQMCLDHPRHRDLCSPTSTTNAINYLLGTKLDPVLFAKKSRDEEFDIYGNWILNVAEAYTHLHGRFETKVERLADFASLHAHLMKERPVVVSVKGPIPGAPLPYQSGHLMCVVGYEEGKVYCIDSGFPTDESTFVSYAIEDFLTAWGIRRNLAYTFYL